jgi:hypothetical protein
MIFFYEFIQHITHLEIKVYYVNYAKKILRNLSLTKCKIYFKIYILRNFDNEIYYSKTS